MAKMKVYICDLYKSYGKRMRCAR